ncbi:hypothetical protein ABZ313_35650 [Streptomyces sp. NPDC006251]|uniref:hypothetical protein n=1 Tax=Streptomyces sp. NPDC006251 TaxID=3155718 RepID=UPI0033B419B8
MTTTSTPEAGRQVTLPGLNGAQHTVTLGVLDRAAKLAFSYGQCHALARALSEETGWPMAVLIDPACCQDADVCDDVMFGDVCSCQFEHLVAVRPDGFHVDITGAFEPGTARGCEGKADVPVTDAMWEYLVHSPYWSPPAIEAARTFVAPLLTALRAAEPTSGPATTH